MALTPAMERAARDVETLHDHLTKDKDKPVVLTYEQFEPLMPLFISTSKISDDTRNRLTQEYFSLTEWGYRPITVTYTDADGVPREFRISRLFVGLILPNDPNYAKLADNNRKLGGSDRLDVQAQVSGNYLSAFVDAQTSDEVIDAVAKATKETEEIISELIALKNGGQAPSAAADDDDNWTIDD